jgi:protein O-mannosyl-transferase
MAKKQEKNVSRQPREAAGAAVKPAHKENKKAPVVAQKTNWLASPLFFALLTALLTFVVLSPCLDNKFTNWDDPGYVKDNPLIKDLTGEGIKNIFSHAVMGNYHPLTIFSYALEYSVARLDPFLFHLDSLLLHVLCTVLVFWFTLLFTKNNIASFVAAMLFGLHPMHMESVAWVAARKDVMFGSFFMASCIAYFYFSTSDKNRPLRYGATILFFIGSILSKPVAVTLPLTLLLIDYLTGRLFQTPTSIAAAPNNNQQGIGKINLKVILEKIPFLLISLGAGIRSVQDQKDFNALNTLGIHFNFIERIALGAYALTTYILKALVPYNLSNFYPYPQQDSGKLPFLYYLYILVPIALVVLVFRFFRKNRSVIFGSLFFMVNIVLLLQFISVGGAILADRYTYIPYVGLFFIIGTLVARYGTPAALKDLGSGNTGGSSSVNPTISYAVVAGMAIYIAILGYISNERCKVWYDTVSLWRDETAKHPDAPSAFNNLGFEYFNRGNMSMDAATRKLYFDSSELLLKEAIRLQPTFFNPYVSLGEVERTLGNFQVAKNYYYTALHLDGKDIGDNIHNAYLGLAIVYCISGQNERNIFSRYPPETIKSTPELMKAAQNAALDFDSARICFSEAIRLKYAFPEAHSNFGNYWDMMGNFDSSLHEYTVSANQNPDMYASYLNRARLYMRHGKMQEALKDFALALEVGADIGEIYAGRAICYYQMGNRKAAWQDLQKAVALHFTEIDPNVYKDLQSNH